MDAPVSDITARAGEPPPEDTTSSTGVVLVAGSSLPALGVVAGAVWWRDRSDKVRACDQGGACTDRDGIERQRRSAAGLTVVSAVGFATLFTVGLIMLIGDGEDEHEASVRCAPGPASLSCEVRF